jgi:hypothetical protein
MLLKTKGQKVSLFAPLSMLMIPSGLVFAFRLSLDVYENKRFIGCIGHFSGASVDVYENSGG